MIPLKTTPKAAPEAYKPSPTVVTISGDLHRRLKAKAKAEGRKLGAMVEAKLEELVPQEPELALK